MTNPISPEHRSTVRCRVVLLSCVFLRGMSLAADPAAVPEEVITRRQSGIVQEKEGTVMFKPSAQAEIPANVPQPLVFGDAVRTRLLSRAAVQLDDRSVLRLKDLTRLQIERPHKLTGAPIVRLGSGEIYVSSRGGAQPFRVE